jgi:hypothetical protein
MPPIYVQASSRDDAEQLAWSLLSEDVRLAFEGDEWGVRVPPDALDAVERCIGRLQLGPVAYRPS